MMGQICWRPDHFFSVSGVGLFRSRGSFFVRSRGSVFVRSRGRFCSVSGVGFFQSRGSVFFGLGVRFFSDLGIWV